MILLGRELRLASVVGPEREAYKNHLESILQAAEGQDDNMQSLHRDEHNHVLEASSQSHTPHCLSRVR